MPAIKALHDTTGTFDLDLSDFDVCQDIIMAEPIVEETTKGGILMPDMGELQRVRMAIVVAVGPGRMYETGTFIAQEFRVGDLIVYGTYESGGERLKFNGREFLNFRPGDIIARKKRDTGYFGPRAA